MLGRSGPACLRIVRPRIVAIAAGLLLAASAQAAPPLRIAVVHDVGTEGMQTWLGAQRAAAEYEEDDESRLDVELLRRRYTSEAQGLEVLLGIVGSGTSPEADPEERAHLVIGPTDSGVFVALGEHRELLSRAWIPVISPLVAADVPNAESSWRFRTNVNVVLRARAIATFLAQRGTGPIAVLYADNEFGKLAEKAFRGFLSQDEEGSYSAYVYRGIRDSQPIRTLLQDRPWAVGVFGERQMIADVRSDLRKLNQSWYSYDPIVFSVIDARGICQPGIYFVSLVTLPNGSCRGDPTLEQGEPYGLALDTTKIALAIADATQGKPGTEPWQKAFRARFSKALDGREELLIGNPPRIRFAGRENRAELAVYTVAEDEIVAPPAPPSTPARRMVANWIDVRARRFGMAPLVNVFTILLVVGGLTFFDAARWHSGGVRELPRRRPFRRLLYFNVAVALAVFFALAEAEAGPFRWDFLFGALVVAFGYEALIKTTLLETPAGQRLGLSQIYDRALRRMNDKIMVMRADLMHEKVGFVAQTNSLAYLRDTLRNVYRRAKTRERQDELIRALDEELDSLPEGERSRACAERLLAMMSWRQLQEWRLVPSEIDARNLIGPDPILRASRDHVLRNPEIEKRLDENLHGGFAKLAQDEPERAKAEELALQEELQTATTDAGRVYRKARYLFARWNYDLDRIEASGLIPPEFREEELRRRAELSRPWWQRAWRRIAGRWRSRDHAPTRTSAPS